MSPPAGTDPGRNSRTAGPRLVVAGVTALAALPVGLGLAGVLAAAFGALPGLSSAGTPLQGFLDLVAEPAILRSSIVSVQVGLAATLLSVLGVALFVSAYPGGRAVGLVRTLLSPILAVPHAAAAFSLAFLIAPSGFLFRFVAEPLGLSRPLDLLIVNDPMGIAMIAGLVAKELPFLLLVALAALPQVDPGRRVRVARSLGYGRVAAFLFSVWPDLYARIRLPVLAVIAYSSSVVDVALILGPMAPPPLSVRVLQWASDPDIAMRQLAAAGAVLQLALTGLCLLLWVGLERIGRWMRMALASNGRRIAADRPVRALAGAIVGLSAGAILFGIAALALWSVAGLWQFPDRLPATYGLRTWTRATDASASLLSNTAAIATLSTAAALLLVVLLLEAHRRIARSAPVKLTPTIAALLYLPLIVPQVAFVLGLQIAIQFLDMRPSIALLAAVHLIFVMPYVTLALAAPWYGLDPRYERQATSLGHSYPSRLLTIRLPLLVGPMATACAIGLATSVGQYLPTAVIGAGRFPTITTEAVALSSGGNPRVIGAYALLQMLLPAVGFTMSGALPFILWRRRRGMKAPT